jgi:hypothetical protein
MTTNEVAVRCSRCGTEFPGARRFCTACGKPNTSRVNTPLAPAPSSPPTPVQAPPSYAPRVAAPPVQAPPSYPPRVPAPQAGSSGPRSYVAPLPVTTPVSGIQEPLGWETLLLYSALSLGVVGYLFAFKQTLWAKRMDPGCPAHGRLLLACVLPVLAIALLVIGVAAPPNWHVQFLIFAAIPVFIVSSVLAILYAVSMVNTLRAVAQFNAVPLRVRMAWGLLGGVLYFQHCIRSIELHCGALQNP